MDMSQLQPLGLDDILAFKYKFELKNNVKASLVFDSHNSAESHINYDYSYTKTKGRRDVELIVEQRVHAKYSNGVLKDVLNVTYNIINPKNLGREFMFGIDVSTNSKVFLDINYTRNLDGNYAINEIHKGSLLIYSATENNDTGLLNTVESPLDIETVIVNKHGCLNVPIAMTESDERLFIDISEKQLN
jgi:hypothetical protein